MFCKLLLVVLCRCSVFVRCCLLLCVSSCLKRAVRWLMRVVCGVTFMCACSCCALCVVCCLLVVRCSLCVCCLLFVVCCLLFVVRCSLYVVCRSVLIVVVCCLQRVAVWCSLFGACCWWLFVVCLLCAILVGVRGCCLLVIDHG